MQTISANTAIIKNLFLFNHFQKRPVCELSHSKKYGFIITNPPYGERIETKESIPEIYAQLGKRLKELDSLLCLF